MVTGALVLGDNAQMISSSLKRYAWLSVAAALVTIVLKGFAWWITGSVGLLSDAIESLVNLAGATVALVMLAIAERPEDESHAFGHGKAEYFSSGFEGLLIVVAAAGIGVAAIERLLSPQAVGDLGIGLGISVSASVVNLAVGRILLGAGRRHHSITLEADGHHLLADVWTSAGVIGGLLAVGVTGWQWLDPAAALLVAMRIVYTGWHLLRRSMRGLMDGSLPAAEVRLVAEVVARYESVGVTFHALRTREAGRRQFVSLHLLVPGEWSVAHGHQVAERVEEEIRQVLPLASVITHLEPRDDPASLADIGLDR